MTSRSPTARSISSTPRWSRRRRPTRWRRPPRRQRRPRRRHQLTVPPRPPRRATAPLRAPAAPTSDASRRRHRHDGGRRRGRVRQRRRLPGHPGSGLAGRAWCSRSRRRRRPADSSRPPSRWRSMLEERLGVDVDAAGPDGLRRRDRRPAIGSGADRRRPRADADGPGRGRGRRRPDPAVRAQRRRTSTSRSGSPTTRTPIAATSRSR